MKYLKRFDEELDPDKYVRVGNKLKNLGKKDRGIKLIDYGSEKKWGLYNILYAGGTYRHGVVTNLRCYFHFGIPHWVDLNGDQAFTAQSKSQMKIVESEEQLLMDWSNGDSELGFTLDFRFDPTEGTIKADSGTFDRDDIPLDDPGLPLFSIVVRLSDWTDGLSEYNTDHFGMTNEPGDEDYCDVIEMYEGTKTIDISISTNFNYTHNGIFADRKSALKFKRLLPNFVNEHKSKIMDLLSVLNSDSDTLEKIIESINGIGINYFYHDDKSNEFGFKKIYDKSVK